MADNSEARRRNDHFRPDTVLFPSSKKWNCMELIFRRQTETFWYFRERLACLTMRNRVVSVGLSGLVVFGIVLRACMHVCMYGRGDSECANASELLVATYDVYARHP